MWNTINNVDKKIRRCKARLCKKKPKSKNCIALKLCKILISIFYSNFANNN